MPDLVPRTRVAVLGAGYGGLRAALALAGERGVDVTLIDRDARPADKTRLHTLGGGAPEVDLGRLLAGTRTRFVRGEVTAIERQRRQLGVGSEAIEYDYLVLAPGSRTATLGVSGVREHALVFDTPRDSTRFRASVEALRRSRGHFAVVGAGPTGVEVATEAARVLPGGHVTLVEASPRILAGLDRLARLYTLASLRRQGVRVLARRSVVALEPGRIRLVRGEDLPADAVAWCAGVEPSPLLAQAGLAPPGTPAAVDALLVSTRDERVYVVGDSAAGTGPAPARPSAQDAVQQGDFVARDLVRRLAGQAREPYRAAQLGQVVTLGCDAIGQLRVGGASLPVFGAAAQLVKAAATARNRLTLVAGAQRARAIAA